MKSWRLLLVSFAILYCIVLLSTFTNAADWSGAREETYCESYNSQNCCTKELQKSYNQTGPSRVKQRLDLPSYTHRIISVEEVSLCKKTDKGKEYRGTLAVTKSGKRCQAWASQTPNAHSNTPSNHPYAGLESNYCRNPDDSAAPWCYTVDNQRREFCFIPKCPLEKTETRFVGRNVYMSHVYRVLRSGQYQATADWDRKKEFHIFVKADTFYCDEREKISGEEDSVNRRLYSIPGIKKFELVTRALVADNCILDFEHNGVATKVAYPPEATKNGANGRGYGEAGRDGEDGPSGIDGHNGTDVTITYLTAEGSLKVKTKGVQGATGGDGANGGNGSRGKDGSCSFQCKNTRRCVNHNNWCDKRTSKNCLTEFSNKVNGKNGGNGGKGGAAGKPGNGGSAGTVKVYLRDEADTGVKFTFSGCRGTVGTNSANAGVGGKGGAGGGTGRTGHCAWKKEIIPSGGYYTEKWYCKRTSDTDCPVSRGSQGVNGVAKTSLQGTIGERLKLLLSSDKASFQTHFDESVQELVLQHVEELFLEGRSNEAKKILEDVKNLMTSTQNIEYARNALLLITSGLNYFGYKDLEFSAIGWQTAKQTATKLLKRANDQAANINTLLKYINDNDVRMVVNEQFITSVLVPPTNELTETDRRISLEHSLKSKAIEILGQMEDHMYTLAEKMKKDLEAAINRRNVNLALEAVQFGLSLLGGFLSFKGATNDKNKIDKFGGGNAILGGATTIMGYVTQHALRGSKGRMCYDKYDDMEKFANTMMEFDEFIEKDPLQIDYTALDSTAKAELLKVQALEKRDDLLLGFKCLIDFVGFPGDVLEGTIGAYFDYSFSRLNVIGQVIEHDINIKQLQFKKQRLQATINEIRSVTDRSNLGVFNPALQNARLLFKERMVEVFREIEKGVLRALYEKAKAFQFVTLWDTKLFEQVQLAKRSQQTAVGDVYFNRHLYLQELDSKLDHLECKLRNCMAQTDRYVIDDDNAYMWILTPERNKELFDGIQTAGVGSFTLTKEGICSSDSECVNIRLNRIFVEVLGDNLFVNRSIIRIEFSHSGQNIFYMPPYGSSNITYVQTKEKLVTINYDKAHISNTECYRGAFYCSAPFPEHTYVEDMCSLDALTPADQLYGTEPCRSLFSQYTINLPKTDTEHGSITKNDKYFDWSKVNKIKVFAAVTAFKNYPDENACAGTRGCEKKK